MWRFSFWPIKRIQVVDAQSLQRVSYCQPTTGKYGRASKLCIGGSLGGGSKYINLVGTFDT